MSTGKVTSTQSVHSTRTIDKETRALIPPIFQNAAFAFDDMDTWIDVALKKTKGDIYSRNSNPTTNTFEQKMANFENAECATSFSTGMAAISTTLFSLLRPGKKAVTVRDAYGATYLLFTEILPDFGIDCNVGETEDHDSIEKMINEKCDLVYLETPTNPMLKILDLERFISAAHNNGAIVVVDNTFATPVNQKPLDLGADLVIHSATKFLCGHGDVLGGVVCGKREMVDTIYRFRELTGPSLDSNSAYLMLRSLKTLNLRIERQNNNAMELAQYLSDHPRVDKVYYPGLKEHKWHEVAKSQMSGFGGVLSFELKGGEEEVKRFLPQLKYAYMAANLGQVETIVGTPGTTSHVELSAEERKEAGVPEGLVRYSVGIEDVEDLKTDINSALNNCG